MPEWFFVLGTTWLSTGADLQQKPTGDKCSFSFLLGTEVNNLRSVFAHGKTTAQKYNKFSIKQSFKIRSKKKTHSITNDFGAEDLIISENNPDLWLCGRQACSYSVKTIIILSIIRSASHQGWNRSCHFWT